MARVNQLLPFVPMTTQKLKINLSEIFANEPKGVVDSEVNVDLSFIPTTKTECDSVFTKCTFVGNGLTGLIFKGAVSNSIFTIKVSKTEFSQVNSCKFEKEVAHSKFLSNVNGNPSDFCSFNGVFDTSFSGQIRCTDFAGELKNVDFSNVQLYETKFSGVNFSGYTTFFGTKFNEKCYFCDVKPSGFENPSVFRTVPNFVNALFGDFNDAGHDTCVDKSMFNDVDYFNSPFASRSLKRLQSYYESIGNTEAVKTFFEMELKAKNAALKAKLELCFYWAGFVLLNFFYRLTSNFGKSILRPLLCYIFVVLIFANYFTIHERNKFTSNPSESVSRNLIYAIEKSLPIEFKATPPSVITNESLKWEVNISFEKDKFNSGGVLIEKILSLLFFFLMGLGIRNHFKIK